MAAVLSCTCTEDVWQLSCPVRVLKMYGSCPVLCASYGYSSCPVHVLAMDIAAVLCANYKDVWQLSCVLIIRMYGSCPVLCASYGYGSCPVLCASYGYSSCPVHVLAMDIVAVLCANYKDVWQLSCPVCHRYMVAVCQRYSFVLCGSLYLHKYAVVCHTPPPPSSSFIYLCRAGDCFPCPLFCTESDG